MSCLVFLAGSLALGAAVPAISFAENPEEPRGDLRRFMHGIAAVPGATAAESYVFFSSIDPEEEPPRPGGSWTHDVYMTRWNSEAGTLDTPSRFIARPEAQEPVSAARNAAGNIMLTFEDGWDAPHTVTQRYGVYDSELNSIKAYPNEVEPGGHSGHVTAVGDDFIVFYSDGWVNGGGEQDLGSGQGVYAKVYDTWGNERHDIDVVHMQRAWWPRLAGGSSKALLVWQELMPDRARARMKAAVLDPRTGVLGAHLLLHEDIRFYRYDAAWLPGIERFMIVGTAHGKGFVRLISEEGEVTGSLACMPATVREASLAVDEATGHAYMPATDGRLLQLHATRHSVSLTGVLDEVHGREVRWRPMGSLGLFGPDDTLHWLSLTEKGLDHLRFDLTTVKPPPENPLCE